MALKSSVDKWHALANVYAVLERFCGLKSPSPRRTSSAEMASKSSVDKWPASANAHAVLERFYGLKSPSPRRITSAEMASKSSFDKWPEMANAQGRDGEVLQIESAQPPAHQLS